MGLVVNVTSVCAFLHKPPAIPTYCGSPIRPLSGRASMTEVIDQVDQDYAIAIAMLQLICLAVSSRASPGGETRRVNDRITRLTIADLHMAHSIRWPHDRRCLSDLARLPQSSRGSSTPNPHFALLAVGYGHCPLS
jgi:hypothetical protein